MKFTNGYWLAKEGVQLEHPRIAYDHKVEKEQLTLYLPYQEIQRRGDTLNLGLTTLTFSTPQNDVIKVSLVHHDKTMHAPSFTVDTQPADVKIDTDKEDMYIFKSGSLEAKVPKQAAFKIDFFGEDRLLTSSMPKAQAKISGNDGKQYMREQLSLDPYELVYGLGERFTPFIKNGQTVDIWNQDGGTGSEQAYKNIPFYLTNKGYGIFVDHPEAVSFEVASENVSRTQFSVEGQRLDYYIIYGPDMKAILEKYTDLTGKPALPPAWSFGLWLSTSFTTDYSEETVMHFIDEMQARDIPFDVFHFDCFWMKEFEWCGFEWNDELFPDPKGLLKKIHDKGLKVSLWINPYIGQKASVYQECKEKGYFIKNQAGEVWQWDLWQAGQGIIDFTNPEARQWYKDRLKELIELGVDSFKTDFGERIPEDAVYYDGSDPKKCTIIMPIYTMKPFLNCWRKCGKIKPFFLPVLLLSVPKNFQSIGEATIYLNILRWQSLCVVAYPLSYLVSDFGAMILAGLKNKRPPTCINVGRNLVYCRPTVDTMAMLNIGYHGILAKKQQKSVKLFQN